MTRGSYTKSRVFLWSLGYVRSRDKLKMKYLHIDSQLDSVVAFDQGVTFDEGLYYPQSNINLNGHMQSSTDPQSHMTLGLTSQVRSGVKRKIIQLNIS